MTPRVLVRSAALAALATAAANTGDPDFAPLAGAQVFLGQSWPSQSPSPGTAPLPNQLLIYGWEEKSKTVSGKATAPQFETELTLVVEARVETRAPAATALLPAAPSQADIDAAVDGALDDLCFAVKKAICQHIGLAAQQLYLGIGNGEVIEEIREVDTAARYDGAGQRIAGNGAVAFSLVYGERFEPLIPNDLNLIFILVNPTAGGLANSGNTGNGTVGAVTVGLGAQAGSYDVAFTSPTGFTVTAPDATAAGSGTVGALFAGGGLTFTISAGTTPFVAGDGFTIIVQVIAGNLVAFT